jgi:hypothetical protein
MKFLKHYFFKPRNVKGLLAELDKSPTSGPLMLVA